MKNGVGQELTISKPPQRVVSMAPSNTEILFSLGLNAEIVGATEFCDYPPQAKLKEKIGGFLQSQV